MPQNALFSYLTSDEPEPLLDPRHSDWNRCDWISIDRDWRGRSMLQTKGLNWRNLTRVASLWNPENLLFHFECWFDSLNVNPQQPRDRPSERLWDTDVVEIFLRPESCDDYFEIEISPLGQWLDAHITRPRLDVDFHWRSGLRLESAIQGDRGIWWATVAIPFGNMVKTSQISRAPALGEAWRLNLFRIAGKGEAREYLAWRPTFTNLPDFHIPQAFGNLFFLEL